MKCPECGIPLSLIEDKCPACEADLTSYKNKRKKKTLILSLILVILIVATVLGSVIYINITKYNGKYTYVPDSEVQFYLDQLNYSLEDLNINYYIVVDKDTFTMTTTKNGETDTINGSFSIDGEKVTLKTDEITYKGTYNKNDKTITITAGDSSMIFKKQDKNSSK